MEPLSPYLGTETGWPPAAQPGGHLALDIRTPDLREDPLGWPGWISLQSKRLAGVFSSTTVQKHQFFNAQLSL